MSFGDLSLNRGVISPGDSHTIGSAKKSNDPISQLTEHLQQYQVSYFHFPFIYFLPIR